MRALRRLLVTVVVLAALLLALDRGAAFGASRLAARGARHQGAGDANVRILGFPFLTQVARGRLGRVTVSEREVTGNGLTLDDLHATARGVHLSLGDVAAGTVTRVPIDRVDGSAVITYATLTSGITQAVGFTQGLSLSLKPADPGDVTATVTGPLGLHVSLTVPVPTVSGGRLQVGALVQRFADVLPSSVATDLSLPLPSLPYGLTLGTATAQADGIHFTVSGTDVTVK